MSEGSDLADVAGFSGARLARIDNFFNVEVARGALPGAVMLVERRGETVFRRAWGYRNRAAGAPMTPDTIFRIYSMTKPMVSIAAMMLAAEGRLHLDQPIADFVPAFADAKVLVGDALVTPIRPPSVHDLLRHTAGLTYGARTGGPLAPRYAAAELWGAAVDNAVFAERVGRLPLACQPGTFWEYSVATDVLGRIVEVAAGRSLGAVLQARLSEPLGMADTGFAVRAEDHDRIAEPFPDDRFDAGGPPMFDPRRAPTREAGGMGLVSTLDDYARFCRMLLAEGTLGEHVYLGRHTLRHLASDHVGPETGIIRAPDSFLAPGLGFGLGVSVRRVAGALSYPGSPGEFGWSGIGGTYFWIDPALDLFGILLAQAPRHRLRHRVMVKTMVTDALVGASGLRAEKRRRRSEA